MPRERQNTSDRRREKQDIKDRDRTEREEGYGYLGDPSGLVDIPLTPTSRFRGGGIVLLSLLSGTYIPQTTNPFKPVQITTYQ